MIKLISIWEFLELSDEEILCYKVEIISRRNKLGVLQYNSSSENTKEFEQLTHMLNVYDALLYLKNEGIVYKDKFRDRWMIKERIDSE